MPLVTIAIPTFNRADTLREALDSALAQTHEELEIVVADNASSDGTAELCREYAARDERIRVVRHERNLGPTANINHLFGAAAGEFTQMLADDDRLEPAHVAACLAAHDPAHAIVAGRARYYDGERLLSTGVEMQLEQDRGAARVVAYLRAVEDNGTFYGLLRTAMLRRAAPMRNVLGNDWLLVAAMAYQGRVATIPDVAVHRAAGGTSANLGKILATFGAGPVQARLPHVVIAREVWREIAHEGAVYRELPRGRRLRLAARSAAASMDWPAQAWYLAEPVVEAGERHALTRPLARAYRRGESALVARRREERAERREHYDAGGAHP